MDPIQTLRQSTEDDVIAALKNMAFDNWPQDEAELLEFFNRMLDLKLGGGAGEEE